MTIVRVLQILWINFLVIASGTAYPQNQDVEKMSIFWEKNALMCTGENYSFPSKRRDALLGCEDGDMTLFNGLLCASGDIRGCNAVKESFDERTGIWHRSPRIKLLGRNDRGNADSSPDMALGIQLYLTITKDVVFAKKWIEYLNSTYTCIPSPSSSCEVALPKFCSHDDCVMRPQDVMMLKVTVDFLQEHASLGQIPPGPLNKALSAATGSNAAMLELLARIQRPGFPPHLVGVGVLTMRLSGREDSRLDIAARVLANRFPENAFFLWLSGSSGKIVGDATLSQCPASLDSLIDPWDDWVWESYGVRNDGTLPRQHSSMWDCIFMANMLRDGMVPNFRRPTSIR